MTIAQGTPPFPPQDWISVAFVVLGFFLLVGITYYLWKMEKLKKGVITDEKISDNSNNNGNSNSF